MGCAAASPQPPATIRCVDLLYNNAPVISLTLYNIHIQLSVGLIQNYFFEITVDKLVTSTVKFTQYPRPQYNQLQVY